MIKREQLAIGRDVRTTDKFCHGIVCVYVKASAGFVDRHSGYLDSFKMVRVRSELSRKKRSSR